MSKDFFHNDFENSFYIIFAIIILLHHQFGIFGHFYFSSSWLDIYEVFHGVVLCGDLATPLHLLFGEECPPCKNKIFEILSNFGTHCVYYPLFEGGG